MITRVQTVYWLIVLTILFVFRIGAQLLQWHREYNWLPGFELWHSGTLPYPWLLASQLLVMLFMMIVIYRVWRGSYRAIRSHAIALLTCGSIYLIAMVARLLLGMTVLAGHHWFGAILPALFHIVLAAFMLVLAGYELSVSRRGRSR